MYKAGDAKNKARDCFPKEKVVRVRPEMKDQQQLILLKVHTNSTCHGMFAQM